MGDSGFIVLRDGFANSPFQQSVRSADRDGPSRGLASFALEGFCFNNPVQRVDPLGLKSCTEQGGTPKGGECCCAGEVMVPDSECCLKKTDDKGTSSYAIYADEDAATKVEEVSAWPHGFLRVEQTSCGFWPKGGKKKYLKLIPPFFPVEGYVYSPDPMDGGQSGVFVELNACEYDFVKFEKCVKDACKPRSAEKFHILFHNCRHWRGDLINECKENSKR